MNCGLGGHRDPQNQRHSKYYREVDETYRKLYPNTKTSGFETGGDGDVTTVLANIQKCRKLSDAPSY